MAHPTDSKSTGKDRYGFTLRACYRCGGCGEYSYNQMDGSRCYGCGGTGWVHPRGKVAKAFDAFRKARRALVEPTGARLEVGDQVSKARGASEDYRTIVAIAETAESCGRWSEGVFSTPSFRSGVVYRRRVTFDDGSVETVDGSSVWVRRNRTVDPAPYLAQAGIK